MIRGEMAGDVSFEVICLDWTGLQSLRSEVVHLVEPQFSHESVSEGEISQSQRRVFPISQKRLQEQNVELVMLREKQGVFQTLFSWHSATRMGQKRNFLLKFKCLELSD